MLFCIHDTVLFSFSLDLETNVVSLVKALGKATVLNLAATL